MNFLIGLRCFYFIVDTLRSIHLHAPSTVDPTWSAKMGKNAQYDLRELCDGLILAGHSLPSDLAVNDYLLVLFDMVSTINTLLSSLGPFNVSFMENSTESLHSIQSGGDKVTVPNQQQIW